MCKTLFYIQQQREAQKGWPTPLGGILPPPVVYAIGESQQAGLKNGASRKRRFGRAK